MLPILACLAGAKWGGVGRENPPPFCPYLLMAYPLRRHVGMYHPKLRGGGVCFLRRFGLKTGIDFVPIFV